MTFSVWATFFLIAFTAISTPGPGNLNTMRRAIQLGWRRTVPSIFGNAIGLAVLALFFVAAMATLLTTYMWLFDILSLVGIAYIAWLGLKMIFSNRSISVPDQQISDVSAATLFTESFIVSATNPKAVMFYLAVFPRVLNQNEVSAWQIAVVVLTCCLISLLTHSIYALFASWIRQYLIKQASYNVFGLSVGMIFVAIAASLIIGWVTDRGILG